MENFSDSEFLYATLTKSIVQNLYKEQFSNVKYKKSLVYTNANKGYNVGVGSLQGTSLGKKTDYVAFSFINIEQDIVKADQDILEKMNLNICFNDSETLPITRLKLQSMETYSPQNLGFASSKSNCTERKILSKILYDFINLKDKEDGELGGVLYLYTKLEPCAYCIMAMQKFIEQTGTRIVLIYEELIFELVRDNLNSPGRIHRYNILYPTEYNDLQQYDSGLAEQIRNSIVKRKEVDIATNTNKNIYY